MSTGTFSVASLLLMAYDTGGAEKLYNFFIQPLFANNEELIEMAASKTYGAVTDLWFVFIVVAICIIWSCCVSAFVVVVVVVSMSVAEAKIA